MMNAETARNGGLAGRVATIASYLLLACLVGLFLHYFLKVRETSDDTYIALRYAKNFIEGHGLVYNIGERVEGYSDFLWVILLSGFMKAGVEPRLATKILGFAFGAGTLVLLFGISKRLYGKTVPFFFHLAPPALLVFYRYFDYWCAQGLETPLFIFLVVGGVYFYLAEEDGGSWYLAPVFFALSALTRPEGPMFLGLTFMHRLVRSRMAGRPLRDDLLWLAPFLAIFLPHLIWRYSYYGYLLPNTFYAKSQFDMVQLEGGWKYLKGAVRTMGQVWPAMLAVMALPFFTRKNFSVFIYLVSLVAAFSAYIVVIGGDIQTFSRFFVHLAPLFFLLCYMAVAGAYLWLKDRPVLASAPYAVAAVFVGVVSFACYSMVKNTVGYTKYLPAAEMWAEIGKWINENTPPNTLIAVTNAGATPYFADRTAIDMCGLNDSFIAHNPDYTMGESLHEKKYNSVYVLSRKPDIIVFRFCDWPRASCEQDLFNREAFRSRYAPLNVPLKYGIYTVYRRIPDDMVRSSGEAYTAGLGRRYGYDARMDYALVNPEYIYIVKAIMDHDPNIINHYRNALYFWDLKMYKEAASELDNEDRINPGFAPSRLLRAIMDNEQGDKAGYRVYMAQFNKMNKVHETVGGLFTSQISFCF